MSLINCRGTQDGKFHSIWKMSQLMGGVWRTDYKTAPDPHPSAIQHNINYVFIKPLLQHCRSHLLSTKINFSRILDSKCHFFSHHIKTKSFYEEKRKTFLDTLRLIFKKSESHKLEVSSKKIFNLLASGEQITIH